MYKLTFDNFGNYALTFTQNGSFDRYWLLFYYLFKVLPS